MLDSFCETYVRGDGKVNAKLYESSADCIKILDLNGCLRQVNPGGIRALELDHPTQLLGKIWWSVWPAESQSLAENAFRLAAKGQNHQFQAFCPTVQGTPCWWDVVASPVLDSSGEVREVMVVSRDITELFEAREALKKANEFKDVLLAMVAHELRNPISAAMTTAHLLKLKASDPESIMRFAEVMHRQLDHMSRIAEDLLDTSRARRGELSLNVARVDLKSIISQALEQLAPASTAKKQLMTVTLCDDECMVMGDATRLVQVAGNIIANAVRYTPANGVIQVELTRSGDVANLIVTDSGIGISPERIASIFDLYTREHKPASSNRSDGLGLGLTLAKALVIKHGGEIKATSKGPNLGSQFSVCLPTVP